MPADRLARFCLLPELKLTRVLRDGYSGMLFECHKTSEYEVCPKCATISRSVYDRRQTRPRDAPLRNKSVRLIVTKRRFWCKSCHKPFTEPVSGISKGKRYTQRFKEHLLWCCENFVDLKAVRRHTRCSYGFIYTSLYEQLTLNRKKRQNPWPRSIGIDEHRFGKNRYGITEFCTFVIDHKNRKAFEAVYGRSVGELKAQLGKIPGRENVRWVTIDLSSTYRSFIRSQFPNARIVADKFHVVRLLNPAINRKRKEITGDQRKNPIRKLLLKNSKNLDYQTRRIILRWLYENPELKEIYEVKQAIHRLYRTKGYERARRALSNLIDRMSRSHVAEILTLRKTLVSWRTEILNYFINPVTNARVEGFNGKAKLIRKRAYGYKNFENYRLRLLNACS